MHSTASITFWSQNFILPYPKISKTSSNQISPNMGMHIDNHVYSYNARFWIWSSLHLGTLSLILQHTFLFGKIRNKLIGSISCITLFSQISFTLILPSQNPHLNLSHTTLTPKQHHDPTPLRHGVEPPAPRSFLPHSRCCLSSPLARSNV
jgi:hypothetical protein